MDEICTSQLLSAVNRMVLTLTQQNDESKEFVKIFHKQLGSILQASIPFVISVKIEIIFRITMVLAKLWKDYFTLILK